MSASVNKYSRQLILSFYLTWYIYIVATNFDPCAQIWINALVISLIVGIALNVSVNKEQQNVFVKLRLFLIPFAVSSYTGLIRGKDFILIFPPDGKEIVFGLLFCFIAVTAYYLYLTKRGS